MRTAAEHKRWLAEREAERERARVNAQRTRSNMRHMLDEPSGMLSGLTAVPRSLDTLIGGYLKYAEKGTAPRDIANAVKGYVKTATPRKVVRDVASLATPNLAVVDDFAEARAAAREMRAAGENESADQLEQLAMLGPLSVLPAMRGV